MTFQVHQRTPQKPLVIMGTLLHFMDSPRDLMGTLGDLRGSLDNLMGTLGDLMGMPTHFKGTPFNVSVMCQATDVK